MEKLAELRERRVLTLRDLADKSGVAADTINQVELGHRKPRPSTLRKLARALDVDVREFYAELALAGKAEAPSPGPTSREVPIYDVVHKAALLQAQRSVQARNRLFESGHQTMDEDMSPENAAQRYLLDQPKGAIVDAYIELMRSHIQLEHEITQPREELSSVREQERSHS